jgi:formylglycine-generating enzyme required for sulfatase activity
MDPTGQPLPVEGQFCQAGSTAPFQITSEAPLMLGGTAPTNLSSRNGISDDFNSSTLQVLPAAFPKGFGAYWLMKYELTCQQFVDWLNLLTPVQAAFVYPIPDPMGAERFGIVFQGGVYSTSVPARAVNWMNYEAVCAFADWAALRPYTELEYEKACRGPLPAVPDEYSWGSRNIAQITALNGTDGSGMELALPAAANCQYNLTSGSLPGSAIQGPVSVGIFRRTHPGGTREQQGRGYYGNFELTGNVWERPVCLHNVGARTFDGHPGDGALDATGRADEATWPNVSGGGAGYRGANWFRGTAWARVSSRSNASHDPMGRTSHRGIRVGRSAP